MAIPLTAEHLVDFRPPAKPDVTIKVRVPTPYQRDAFAGALVRAGVVHYSKPQVRDMMRAGVRALFPAEEVDERIAKIEHAWQASDREEEASVRRLQKAIEIRERHQQLAVERGAELSEDEQDAIDQEVAAALKEIVSDVAIDDQTKVDVSIMQQKVATEFAPLREAYAKLAEQQAKRDWLTIETYVADWEGLEHRPEPRKADQPLKRHESEYLRRQIGARAFEQLGEFIFGMHGLDEEEEKNLASLLESLSAQDGSTASESKASSDTGSSTNASSGEIRESA